MIHSKAIQEALKIMSFYEGPIDGIMGPLADAAIKRVVEKRLGATAAKWSMKRQLIAVQQMMMLDVGIEVGKIDGISGPSTQYALEQWQNRLRDLPSVSEPKPDNKVVDSTTRRSWPTQADVPKYFGPTGQNQTLYTPPYQLYLYDTKTKVIHLSIHTKVCGSLDRVLTEVKACYSPAQIEKYHMNRFFGSLNVRKMRGGNSWSMHSWGIALDFDATRNQLRWGRDKAAFAKSEYDTWWNIWQSEGWVSLGRERNYDWMHVQAARL
jgi:peptidoglycan hydrolase-like protein with peptidoglycan-binding domain